ncbi:MAG: Ig-like domain-containing protein, partial [Bacteroidales bacterium]|nr:Ig-like domain-containing protein [Bacteroidales bacterium]
MKKGIFCLIATVIAAFFVSCAEEPIEPVPANIAVTSVTLSQSTLALETGSTGTLTANIQPANATDKTVSWQSSNTSVATVQNGTVTAVKAGTATITATAGGKSATCSVTVSDKVIAVTSVEFVEGEHNIYIGKSLQLSVKITPSDASDTPTLTSSDESVATVDQDGNVTGIGLGSATITATAGGKQASYEIEVLNPSIESLTIEPAEITVFQGDTVRFTYIIEPEEVVVKYMDWRTDNSSVLQSTLDENYHVENNGSFVAVGPGTATVSVGINFKVATAQVTVVQPDYMEKEKAALVAFLNANKNHWTRHENWGSEGQVTSEWEGVEMDPSGTHVKALNIYGAIGVIPKEIGDLTELEGLTIWNSPELSYGMTARDFGPLPEEIGNLKKLTRIVIYDYPLTGKLPEGLYTLPNLETLSINRTRFMDASPLPSSIGAMTSLNYLQLNEINLSGTLPTAIGSLTDLTWLCLSGNNLSGSVPVSYSSLVNLDYMDLSGNKLSGTLPSSLANINKYPLLWTEIIKYNLFTQDDIRKSKIPAPSSPVVKTISGGDLDIDAFIKGNNYTVLFNVAPDFPEATEYLTRLEELYKKAKGKGLGVLTYFDNNSSIEPDMSNRDQLFKDALKKSGAEWDSFTRYMYRDYPDEIPFYATKGRAMYPDGPANSVVIIGPDGTVDYTTLLDSSNEYFENALKYLESALNVSMTYYESKDYSKDSQVKTLQNASTGKGIDLVITGDAFSDRMITDGTFEKAARQAMDDLFSVEPLKSLKNRFNVHMVNAVSKNEDYFSGCSTVFSGVFGSGTALGGNNQKALEYAKKAVKDETKMDNVVVLVLMNSFRDGGTCYMLRPENDGVYAGGASVAYVTYKDVTASGGVSNLASTVIHEVAGHGLGKLGDEYAYFHQGPVIESEVSYISTVQKMNWYMNVSVTSDPAKVPWSQFIGDSAFASEKIGVYEGGVTFWSG